MYIGLSLKIIPLLAILGIAPFLNAQTIIPADVYTDGQQIGFNIVGSISNTNPSDNVALVKISQTGHITAVKMHSLLPGGYRVETISSKYILLSKGTQTTLVYQNKFARELMGGKKNDAPDRHFAHALSLQDTYREDGFERRGRSVTITPSFRDKLLNEDLSKVLMQATAIPHMKDGMIKGFRLLQIENGSVYDKGGMQNNDIITEINGVKLDNVGGAVRLLQSLKNATSIKVSLLRNNAPLSIDLNVGQ